MNAVETLDCKVKQLFELSSNYWEQSKITQLYSEYEENKSETIPRVMLFGSYNAGKSSLINALLRREAAEYADVPTTADIRAYKYKGYYLEDTPGVNAPIEHEKVTEAHIKRSELILFVIRQGDQDVKDVYERMFNMLCDDKNIFVVYNHELSQEQLNEALPQLNSILINYAKKYEVDLQKLGEIPLVPVNVKTAMKSGIKGSKPLAEHSGILDFEARLDSWLQEFDNEHHFFDRLCKLVSRCIISPLKDSIQSSSGHSQDIETLQHQRGAIAKEFELLKSQISNHVRAEVQSQKGNIGSLLSNGSARSDLEAGVQQLAEGVIQSTTEFMQQSCETISERLAVAIDLDIKDSAMHSTSPGYEKALKDAVVGGIKKIDQEAIKKGLLLLRKIKLPSIKGKWEKTLARWAGKAAWVVTAVTSAYEIYSASEEQNKENLAFQQQQVGIHQAIESISKSISSSILSEVEKLLEVALGTSLQPIEKKLKSLTSTASKHVKNLEYLDKLKTEIASLRI